MINSAIPWRRRADTFRALEPRLAEIRAREEEVLWACFRTHREAACLGGADASCSRGEGDVNDEDGDVDEFGQGDCAVCCFCFDQLRTTVGVVFWA